ncbi:hypothetical protein BDR26DRAFT_899331 [Obelidium mucronatum]|nr:hypothetical protein BDR26DRAFT_899331 [Obelidium mucronatum]
MADIPLCEQRRRARIARVRALNRVNQRLQVQNAIVDYAAEIPELAQAGSNMAAEFYSQAENMPTNTMYSEIESRELADEANSAGNMTSANVDAYSEIDAIVDSYSEIDAHAGADAGDHDKRRAAGGGVVDSYSEIDARIESRRSPRRGLLERKERVAKAFSVVERYIEERKWAKTVRSDRGSGKSESKKHRRIIDQYMESLVYDLQKEKYTVVDIGESAIDLKDVKSPNDSIILMYLNEELTAVVLQNKHAFPQHLRVDYAREQDKLLECNTNLPQPKENSSHSNKYPKRVTRSGKIDLSIGFMMAHDNQENAELKIRADRVSSVKTLYGTNKYLNATKCVPMLVDRINALFFSGSMTRKANVRKLVQKHEPQSLEYLDLNGGYLLRYLALNVIMPDHCDKKDCQKIPSCLLYQGNFPKDYDIDIPIKPWTILPMMAWKVNHEGTIKDSFTDKFKDRRQLAFSK